VKEFCVLAWSAAIVISLAGLGYCQGPALYWSFNSPNGPGEEMVMKSSLDGSNAQSLPIFGGGGARPIALDVPDGHLYVGYEGTITEYALDGSNPLPIFSTSTNPSGVSGMAVDTIHNKLYWSYNSPNGPGEAMVMQANRDGSNPQALAIFGGGGERPIAVDIPNGHLYVGYEGAITQYGLDGTNPTMVFSTSTNPSGVSGLAILPVPEPSTLVLAVLGMVALLACKKWRLMQTS
jgi:hypothetical protein